MASYNSTRKELFGVKEIMGANKLRLVRVLTGKPLYSRAIFAHKTHMGKRMVVPEGGFLYDIYNCLSRDFIIKKSTQTGISEYLVARAIWRAVSGKNILYVLPTFELKNKFVKERFDKTITHTELYRREIGEDKNLADSVSLKQFKQGSIIFIGSNSTTGFISHPCDDVLIDEMDNCNQDNLVMARERQSASSDKSTIKISNPTILGYGIDKAYNHSSQGEWKINHCGKNWFTPNFFTDVVQSIDNRGNYVIRDKEWNRGCGRDIMPFCPFCGEPYNRYMSGRWEHKEKNASVTGFHVSKMFSTVVTLEEMVDVFTQGLSNDSIMQRFYNGDLGLAYTAAGARITEEMLDACVDENYYLPQKCEYSCIAGVDVGALCHIVIGRPIDNKIQIVNISELNAKEPYEIIALFKQYNVKFYVIDALPETRFARKLIALYKQGMMCYYSQIKRELTINAQEGIITTDRTISLDSTKERIVMQDLILPANARSITNFYRHITNSTRAYDEEKDYYEWIKTDDDHYHHALNYMVLSKKILIMAS